MTTNMRAFRGTVVGLFWAILATPAALPFSHYFRGPDTLVMGVCLVLVLSPFLVAVFGPGAYFLSLIHAFWMERWAERARTRRQIRITAVLLGMPLGAVNLILTIVILGHFRASLDKFTVTWELLVLVIPALAGGAGMGWGVTTDLLPRRRVA